MGNAALSRRTLNKELAPKKRGYREQRSKRKFWNPERKCENKEMARSLV